MKKRVRYSLLVTVLAVLFLFSGCSMDVEQFLRPPQTQGEQQAVQQALETYIHDSGQNGTGYTLCYPVEGQHTAAFVLCDAHGNPIANDDESAALALAFYTLGPSQGDTHINMLRREEDEWVSVADVVGASSDILQVAFGDLDGNGTAELITGWDTYNSRDHHMKIFSIEKSLTTLSDDRLYTRLFVGNLTADGRDSVLLLRIAANNAVYASLETMQDGLLTSLGRVWLDGQIQQINAMTLCRLADNVHGLYIDAIKGTDTAITELVYYDAEGLHAPFCDQLSMVNTVTARPAGFIMRDVDGDAMIEIPSCTLLPSYAAGESVADYAYRTDWSAWDYARGEWAVDMSTVMNAADGYFVVLNDQWRDRVTTTYDAVGRELTLVADDEPLMHLRVVSEDESDYELLFEPSEGYGGCEVRFDGQRLDIDTVRYMVSRLEG
ncbi:MAG: hypothetical protein IJB26_06895 [Clostridia bacterium]|nr:hypothetical protein [Clostridia bacterium]